MQSLILEVETAGTRKTIHVPPSLRHRSLADVLHRFGLPLNTRCGQRGLCDGCVIELLAGALIRISSNQCVAAAQPLSLRACEHRLPTGHSSVRLRIPPRSVLAYQPEIVTDYRINIPHAHDPLVKSIPGRPDLAPVGVAIDIGTTTVVLLLVDLANGRVLAESSMFNQQMTLGDDVITRIALCANDPGMLAQLRHAIVRQTIVPLLQQACAAGGTVPAQIACFTVAGNTTMLHLLAGVNPASMGVSPFTPVFKDHRILTATEVLGDDAPSICRLDAAIHLLAVASAYIGADLCAGILASGLLYDRGPSLLVDVGTNGEIILMHAGRLTACATAAGPAFEGSGLSCGMRAGAGAISSVRIGAESLSVDVAWIGQDCVRRPTGLCGSAYLDLLAEGRAAGLIGTTGRFARSALNSGRVIPWNGADLAVRLAEGDGGRDIVVSQLDIARLLQAKAAVAAGILTLLDHAGLSPTDVRTLYLAGGFGTHMDSHHAIECGLLPGFHAGQIQPVGNTSLAGAYLSLMDGGILEELSKVGAMIEVVELNLDPSFESRYIDQLALPEPVELEGPARSDNRG